jgi:tetratricopeptide (TPR) repeat protein
MPGRGNTRSKISDSIVIGPAILGRDITLQLPPKITTALHGLPEATQSFAGRRDSLLEMFEILAPIAGGLRTALASRGARSNPALAVVVARVDGLAGIGKTALAVRAARTALDRGWFPGGALFIDMAGYDCARSLEPGRALEAFLLALGIPAENIPRDVADRSRLYTSVLAAYAQHGRRILVVIDNVSSREQAEPLLPTDGACAAIVTSRNKLGLLKGRRVELDVLSQADSKRMLDLELRVAHPTDTRVADQPDSAASIARLCGGLAQALHIIAARLTDDLSRPLAEVASELQTERSRLDALEYDDASVRAAFELSYQRLSSPHSYLFRSLSVNPGPDISTEAAAALIAQERSTVQRSLEALARAHLIEPSGSLNRWRMHDLVHDYAKEKAEDLDGAGAKNDALLRVMNYYLHAGFAAARLLNVDRDQIEVDMGAAPVSDLPADAHQAMTWFEAERQVLTRAVAEAERCGLGVHAWKLAWVLEDFLDRRGYWDDVFSSHMIALKAANNIGDRLAQTRILLGLGNAYVWSGDDKKAYDYYEQAHDLYQLPGDEAHLAHCLLDLSKLGDRPGGNEVALSQAEQALALYRAVGHRAGEVDALNFVSWHYAQLGRYGPAISFALDALKIAKTLPDYEYRDADIWDTLGYSYRLQGSYAEAADSYKRAAEIFHRSEDWYQEADSLGNLGDALLDAGDALGAHSAWSKALAILDERKHPDAEKVRAKMRRHRRSVLGIPGLSAWPSRR